MFKEKPFSVTPGVPPFVGRTLHDYPWLIPISVALQALPAAVMIHGFWKNRQLKKELQIERERTKQLRLEQPATPPYPGGHPRPLSKSRRRPLYHD